MTTPLYDQVLEQTGIAPEQIYTRCSSLVQFTYGTPRPARAVTPKVGQKPIRSKRKASKR